MLKKTFNKAQSMHGVLGHTTKMKLKSWNVYLLTPEETANMSCVVQHLNC